MVQLSETPEAESQGTLHNGSLIWRCK